MRMRAGLIFISLLFLVCTCVTDDGDTYKKYFIKYYGTDGDHEAVDMLINTDGTVVILGTTEFPSNSGITRIYVVKTDGNGGVIWEKIIGTGAELAQDIEPIPTGYVILSNIAVGDDQFQFKLNKIDFDGSAMDSLTYDLLSDQFGYTVTPLTDGGFYVVGNALDTDTLNLGDNNLPVLEVEDLLYVRFDDTFLKNNSDEDRIGSSTTGSVAKVFEVTPGNFFAAEYSNRLNEDLQETGDNASDFDNNFNFKKFTFDPGDVPSIWVGDELRSEVLSQTVRSFFDGIFYSVGTSKDILNSSTIFISKTYIGNGAVPIELFENSFGIGRMEGISIYPGIPWCYILANRISDSDGTRDIWLTRVNSFTGDQDPSWSNGFTFGTPTNDDIGKVVMEAPNGDILILGTMNLTNQKKITLVKLNSSGSF